MSHETYTFGQYAGIVEEFIDKTQCTIRLDKHQDIVVDFGMMKVEIKRKCEEK